MRKLFALLLCALLALSFAGCGSSAAPASVSTTTPAPTQAPAAETPAPATETPATEAPAETPEESGADLEAVKALVLSMKGEPIEDLIAQIDMPILSREYFSSCLVQGGQDGVLAYDGFTVYTLVQPDGTETVYDVE